ncbi:MAG: radical SAM family heme chaperone HemW [Firmicutes bacterium]|nr:radical SAM family heme chaperone HemW [Bacillota bacterium]
MGLGLYVHIPICRAKCYYCDFNSFPLHRFSEADLDLYVLAIEYELRHYARIFPHQHEITSVYLGGGTPPLLDTARIVLIMEAIAKYFSLAPECEITVELNPLDCTDDVLRGLKKAGVNRFSLGVQSFDDATLTKLGRGHTADQAHQAVGKLRETTDNLSLDLIYGVPDDSDARWQADLETALRYEPEHLSLYSLQVEEDTPLAHLIEQGLAREVSADIQADQWEYACDRLYPTEYIHYEISNWAKPGKESRHNLGYWLYQPYLGVGAGAAGFMEGYRYRNLGDPWVYTATIRSGQGDKQFPAAELIEKLTKEQLAFERIILALRTKYGLNMETIPGMSAAEFWRRYGEKIISYQQMGLIWRQGQTIGLTESGMSLSNRIFLTFVP